MENINYSELFGIGETGENDQEVAAPETETEEKGENGQEIAEPAAKEDAEPAAEEHSEAAEEDSAQSREDNARFAAARRKAEREKAAAIEALKAENDREWETFFAKANLTNTFTGAPIRTREDFSKWSDAFEEDRAKTVRAKTGMSEEEFDQFIQSRPEIRAAHEAQQRAQERLDDLRMQRQLAEISEMNPEIKTWDDLRADEKFSEIREKVRTSKMSIADAYRLAHQQELIEKAVERAKISERRSAAGKTHMTATHTRGTAESAVPEDVKAEYLRFLPGATPEEIQKHWNRYNRK